MRYSLTAAVERHVTSVGGTGRGASAITEARAIARSRKSCSPPCGRKVTAISTSASAARPVRVKAPDSSVVAAGTPAIGCWVAGSRAVTVAPVTGSSATEATR
ncbi:hypothetical protein D3C72_2174560 [compost metagenome]